MKSDTPISARLKAARSALGLTQEELVAISGIPIDTLRKYEGGRSQPGADAVAGYVRAGINANWLLTGDGPMRMADLVQPGEEAADRVYVRIPRYVMKGAKGEEKDVPSEIASIALSRAWLESRGVAPVDLVYIRMPDDSMTPAIRPGSLVVIDSSIDRLRADGIYCLQLRHDFAVKRLQRDFSGGIRILSDNPAYREEHIPADALEARVRLLGRVIWCGGALHD